MLSANLAGLEFHADSGRRGWRGTHDVPVAWEGIFRKPVNERIQIGLTLMGVVCLLSLMVFVFGNDIWRFSS